VIESGRKNFGPDWNWKGTGGYSQADAFAKHFVDHCIENVSTAMKSKTRSKQ
jgi:hypothetical protein